MATDNPQWRVGRSVGRTLYIGDQLVGLMDTPALAEQVVQAVNASLSDETAAEAPSLLFTGLVLVGLVEAEKLLCERFPDYEFGTGESEWIEGWLEAAHALGEHHAVIIDRVAKRKPE